MGLEDFLQAIKVGSGVAVCGVQICNRELAERGLVLKRLDLTYRAYQVHPGHRRRHRPPEAHQNQILQILHPDPNPASPCWIG